MRRASAKEYTVTCFSPAVPSPVKNGDKVEVKGRVWGSNMTAGQIKNLTKDKAVCRCGPPTVKRAPLATKRGLRGTQTLTGKVANLVFGSNFIQFELVT